MPASQESEFSSVDSTCLHPDTPVPKYLFRGTFTDKKMKAVMKFLPPDALPDQHCIFRLVRARESACCTTTHGSVYSESQCIPDQCTVLRCASDPPCNTEATCFGMGTTSVAKISCARRDIARCTARSAASRRPDKHATDGGRRTAQRNEKNA